MLYFELVLCTVRTLFTQLMFFNFPIWLRSAASDGMYTLSADVYIVFVQLALLVPCLFRQPICFFIRARHTTRVNYKFFQNVRMFLEIMQNFFTIFYKESTLIEHYMSPLEATLINSEIKTRRKYVINSLMMLYFILFSIMCNTLLK